MNRRTVILGAAALAAAPLTAARNAARAAGAGPVRIAYVEWSDAVVATNILAAVLKDMGHQVVLTPVSGAAMWQAVASGDADCMVAAWLPGTHAAYYSKLKDQVDLIGPNVTGARLGWATPDYSPLTYIADLKTGSVDFGAGKIAMQLAVYSRSVFYDHQTKTAHRCLVSTRTGPSSSTSPPAPASAS
jgi:glycine betaine/proline transport system substrate-binding protein